MRRPLSLLLALILLLALAPAAGAESYADRFADWEEIENQAQVAMLTDLGLISGYDDDTFRPYNSITRAEIAKIIALLETADPVPAGTGRFADTVGSWAASYIDYCAERGILSGRGGGLFCPGDNITGRELAKMLLVAAGRDPAAYVGIGWTSAVDNDAEAAGIYDDYERERGQFISRDDACLLINNALQCAEITGYGADGAPQYALDDMMTPRTMLENRFGVHLVTGVLVANARADLRGGAALEEGWIHIDGYTRDFQLGDAHISRDNGLLGRRVTVYGSFGSSYNRAYGIPSVRSGEAYATVSAGQYEAMLESGVMRTANETQFYRDYVPDDGSAVSAAGADDTLTLVDNNGDGILDFVFLHTAAPAE